MASKLKRLAITAALTLLTLLALGIVARQANLLDRHFVFFPERRLDGTPADVGLDFEDVFFTASDGVGLHGWFFPGESETTLLWFHGNAGNISHRISNMVLLRRQLGVSVFIFDYRGYGRSEGTVSEQGTYLDAEAALDYLRSRRDVDVAQNLVFYGRSLGAGVAVEMATRHPARAIILETPFTSIPAMGKTAYPYLPVGLLVRFIRSRYDSLSKITSVRSPVMVLHGDRDEIVPLELAEELFDAANEPKRFYTIEGAGHNDTHLMGGPAYYDAIARFLADPSGPGD